MRKKQKGVECSVEGCKNWCVSNDLCASHNMAVRRYGSVNGKPKVKLICKGCNNEFKHKYEHTGYCSIQCYHKSNKQKSYQAVKRYRSKPGNIEKCRERDSLGKRTKRRFKIVEKCVIHKCSKAGERHHPDYNKPYEIVWLCRQHHKDAHSKRGKYIFNCFEIRCDEVWKQSYIRNEHLVALKYV